MIIRLASVVVSSLAFLTSAIAESNGTASTFIRAHG